MENTQTESVMQLIAAGEGQTLEFKDARIRPSDLAETLVAFANADGGTVLIGVSDSRDVAGVPNLKEAIDGVHMAAGRDCCDPPITLSQIEQVLVAVRKTIVRVRVPRSGAVHHTQGRFLQRVGSRNLALSPEALRELFASRDAGRAPTVVAGDADQHAHLYEILWYHATLTLLDPEGHEAVLERRQHIRFLQNNVAALYDHAWGDGELFVGYRVTPGKVVDRFQTGHRHHTLIALRETKHRGDELTYRVRRRIRDGFLKPSEWLETEIDHPTHDLHLKVVFPKGRPPTSAWVALASNDQRSPLVGQPQADGRVAVKFSVQNPALGERYALHWRW